MAKSWPSTIDKGAELQYTLLEYLQPPAREVPRNLKVASGKDSQNEETPDLGQEKKKTPGGIEEGGETASPEVKGEQKFKEASSDPENSKQKAHEESRVLDEATLKHQIIQNKDEGKEKGSENETEPDNPEKEPEVQAEKQPPSPPANNPKEYFDSPDLKVVVRVGLADSAFLVSSHALAMASKKLREKLNSESTKELEDKPSGALSSGITRVLNLENADPLSLDILFQVMHWKTDNLPQKLTWDSLRKLAVVCDKYECGKILNPWPLIWMEDYEGQATLPGFEDWIFIANALDTRNTKARDISRKLVLESSSISKCGTYIRRDVRGIGIAAHTVEIEVGLIPTRVLEYVLEERANAVESVINLLRQFVGGITGISENTGSFGLVGAQFCQNEACSDIALGSVLRSLKILNLWPLLRPGAPQEWHGSITTLVMQIESLRMSTFLQKTGTLEEKVTNSSSERESLEVRPKNTSKLTSPSPNRRPDNSGFRSKRRPSRGPSSRTGSDTPTPDSDNLPPESTSQKDSALNPIVSSMIVSEEMAVNLYEDQSSTSWDPLLFGGMRYSRILGDRWAASMDSIRYDYPAFEGIHWYRRDYYPCPSAFALGELITKCRNIIADICAGGYQPGA
ncbi:hypothetical protein TWF730_003016 [Orbilia blumenaviensis]|uniref:BTB domain-containing protein n=1 Tax=Orbilia blumenaviensis TaxID=1796055 RepID=A0AAV9U8G5_9PEZI